MSDWSHGLCGCFDNCTVCIITYFAPCYTYGKISEKVGDDCCCHACLFFVPIANLICMIQTRGKVRAQKNIQGSSMGDCCMVCFCGGLALCQEAQEVDAFDGGMAMSMARV